MFKLIKRWWKSIEECEETLARQGIHNFTGYFGQTFILRADNDRQETNKRTAKKSKR
jgi:hypothetical protein